MTVQLSPSKVSRIIRGYFIGMPQTAIAKKAGVDQGSVSHYASRFKAMAAQYGLDAAGKEYRVMNEVEALRCLAVELYKSKLTTEEASQGHRIGKEFLKLGIDHEQHLNLVKVCKEVEDPGFVKAAIKLSQIESETGKVYHKVMKSFEESLQQLPYQQAKVAEAKEELKTVKETLLEAKTTLDKEKEHLAKYQAEGKAKEKQIEGMLRKKMTNLKVQTSEVEAVAALKAELTKKGLDLKTLIKLAEEFTHGHKG